MAEALTAEAPPIAEVLARWAAGQPALAIGPDVSGAPDAALAAIPEACADLVSSESIGPFAAAVAAGEPAARAAMPSFVVAANRLAREAIAEVDRLWSEGRLAAVLEVAPPTAGLLLALGGPDAAFSAGVQLRRAASAAASVGDLAQSRAAYDAAISVLSGLRPDSDELLSTCHDSRGLLLLRLGEFDDAVADTLAARDIENHRAARLTSEAERLRSREHLTAIENNLGEAYRSIGDFSYAVAAYRRSLALWEGLPGAPRAQRGFIRDNLAGAYVSLGLLEDAVRAYEDAAADLQDASALDRLANARGRAEVNAVREDAPAAAAAFDEMLAAALEDVEQRMSAPVFTGALERAVTHLVPADSDAWRARVDGLTLQAEGELVRAEEAYRTAAELAGDAGDRLTQLICVVAAAAVSTHRDPRGALAVASQVWKLALDNGLAAPLALACSLKSALIADGFEPADGRADTLILSLEARRATDFLREHAAGHAPDARLTGADPGIAAQRLGALAMSYLAHERAVEFFTESLHYADALGKPDSIVVRLDWLRRALAAQATDADALAGVLARLRTIAEETDRDDVLLRALLSLGLAAAESGDPGRALTDLHAAVVVYERLRRASGAAKSDLQRFDGIHALYPTVVRTRLDSPGIDDETFLFLQRGRARTILETLHARAGAQGPFEAPTRADAASLLAGLPTPTALVEVTVGRHGLHAVILQNEKLHRVDAEGDAEPLLRVMAGDARERAADIVDLVRTSTILQAVVEGIESILLDGVAVLLAVDDGLANLPFHAVPFGGGSWADARTIGRIPAVAMLRYSAASAPGGASVVAGDSAGNLPGAARECEQVGHVLGVSPLVGRACTLGAFEQSLAHGDLAIVHLAVHGRADPRRGSRASLLFAAESGASKWARLDDLAAIPWRARLIVFSGCSTAVGGPREGGGLYGIAQVATAAGALSTIASLWPVNDTSAAVFMIEFYAALETARAQHDWIDLREVMDAARAAVRAWLAGESTSSAVIAVGAPVADATAHARDGRDLTPVDDEAEIAPPRERDPETRAMLHWAPFVLIGDPILRLSA